MAYGRMQGMRRSVAGGARRMLRRAHLKRNKTFG